MAETAQGLKGMVLKKKVCFAHRILDFHFFSLFILFFLMVLHDVTINVIATI